MLENTLSPEEIEMKQLELKGILEEKYGLEPQDKMYMAMPIPQDVYRPVIGFPNMEVSSNPNVEISSNSNMEVSSNIVSDEKSEVLPIQSSIENDDLSQNEKDISKSIILSKPNRYAIRSSSSNKWKWGAIGAITASVVIIIGIKILQK